VTSRFRGRLFERVGGGAAHAEVARCERATRYQVGRAFRAHHRRGRELATVVSDLDCRRVVEVLDGRSRRVERYLRSLPERRRATTWSRSTPTRPTARRSKHELPRARIVVDHWMTPALDAPD
jgi:transposase